MGERVHGLHGVIKRFDCRDLHLPAVRAHDFRAVALGREEKLRACVAGTCDLVGDAADRADLPRLINRAGAGHELPAVEQTRRKLIDHRQREHHPGTRPAHIVKVVGHLHAVGRSGRHQDPQHGHLRILRIRAEGDLLRVRRAVTQHVDAEPVAGGVLAHDLLHLPRLRDVLPPDLRDDVCRLQRTVRGAALHHLVNHHCRRAAEVVHRGDRRRRLRSNECLLVALLHLLPVRIRRHDLLQRHNRVIRGDPAGQRLHQRHIGAHGHRGHVEVALRFVRVRALDLNNGHALNIAERVKRRPRALRRVRHGQGDIGARNMVEAQGRGQRHKRDGAPHNRGEAAAARLCLCLFLLGVHHAHKS